MTRISLECIQIGSHSSTLVFDSGEMMSSYVSMIFLIRDREIGRIDNRGGNSEAIVPAKDYVGRVLRSAREDDEGFLLDFGEQRLIRFSKSKEGFEYGLTATLEGVKELR